MAQLVTALDYQTTFLSENFPSHLSGMRVTCIQLESLQVGMVYEMHHDGLSHACGHGVYGGLNESGDPQWWVEGYSLREYNERSPPAIDWKRTPMCNFIPQRHPFLKLECVSNFESYVKSKMPKGVRKFFESLLGETFPVPAAEKHVCTSCGKVYIHKKALDNHIESRVCPGLLPEESHQHVCNACGKFYVRKGDLENHVKSGVCSSPSTLRSASFSAPKQVYRCPHCEISLRTQAAMDRHVPLCELKHVGRIPAVRSESTAPFPRYAAVTYPTQFPPLILEDLNEWARGQEPPDIGIDETNDSILDSIRVESEQLECLSPKKMV